MGACISSRNVKSTDQPKTVTRQSSEARRKNFRAVDSLYVADQRKQKNKGKPMAKSLKILHFNDTYNIEPDKKGSGGAAKFVQALNHYQE